MAVLFFIKGVPTMEGFDFGEDNDGPVRAAQPSSAADGAVTTSWSTTLSRASLRTVACLLPKLFFVCVANRHNRCALFGNVQAFCTEHTTQNWPSLRTVAVGLSNQEA